jgi:glutamyl/glutaminyl-tRNA synthetase
MDGSKLSKRNGSRSVAELRETGYLPLAVINYLARLGHYYQANKLMNYNELAEHFAAENLSHSAAHFDEQQLLHWQKEA